MALEVAAAPSPLSIDPRETAVIVVDMQNDFLSPDGMFGRAGLDIAPGRATIEPTARVLEATRRSRMKVVYLKMEFAPDLSNAGGPDAPNLVRHLGLGVGQSTTAPDGSDSRVLIENTWNTDIVPELSPESGDLIMSKHRFSGFFETDLDTTLRANGIKNLIFAGVTTSVCVESTLRDAFFRDYKCLLLNDCVAEPIGNDLARTNHEASLLVIQALFGWVTDSGSLLEALELPPLVASQ